MRIDPDDLVIGRDELHMLAQQHEQVAGDDRAIHQRRAETLRQVAHDGSIKFVPDYLNRPSFGSKPYGWNDGLIYVSPPEMRALASAHEEAARNLMPCDNPEHHHLRDQLEARAAELRRWAKRAEKRATADHPKQERTG